MNKNILTSDLLIEHVGVDTAVFIEISLLDILSWLGNKISFVGGVQLVVFKSISSLVSIEIITLKKRILHITQHYDHVIWVKL